jgi:hypothetical protein
MLANVDWNGQANPKRVNTPMPLRGENTNAAPKGNNMPAQGIAGTRSDSEALAKPPAPDYVPAGSGGNGIVGYTL